VKNVNKGAAAARPGIAMHNDDINDDNNGDHVDDDVNMDDRQHCNQH